MANTDRRDTLISIAYTLMSSRYGLTRAQLRRLVDDYRDQRSASAFERRFERDKAALRNLGFQLIETQNTSEETTAEVRYRIDPRSYALPPLEFSVLESALLGLAAQVLIGGELGRQAARAAARLGASEAAASSSLGFAPRLDAADPRLAELLKHLVRGTPVSFGYRAADGAESTRLVVPWGLGHRDGHWYLAAGDSNRDDVRLFRLDRITSEIVQAATAGQNYVAEAYGRPSRFDMRAALDRLSAPAPHLTARLLAQGVSGGSVAARATSRVPGPDGMELTVGYRDQAAFAAEVAQEGLSVRQPPELATAVGRLLDAAIAAHSEPAPPYTVRKRGGGRTTVETQVARALDLVAHVCTEQERNGWASLEEITSTFDLTEPALTDLLNRLMLCGIPGGLHDELLDVQIEGDHVRIENAAALAAPMNLSVAEVAAVLMGLDALSAAPAGTIGSEAGQAVRDLAERLKALRPEEFEDFDRIVAVGLAASDADAGTATVVGEAIATETALEIVYAGAGGLSDRRIEPFRLVELNNRTYVLAWCRLRNGPRVFRLDRIVSLRRRPGDAPDASVNRDHAAAALEQTVVPDPAGHTVDLLFTGAWTERAAAYRPSRLGQVEGDLAVVDGVDSVVAQINVDRMGHLVGLVAAAGGHVTVLAPEGLREAMVHELTRRARHRR